MDFGMALLAIVFALAAGCLITAAFHYCEKDEQGSAWACGVFGIVCLIFVACLAAAGQDLQKRTPIKSTTPPKVDTLITIKNGVADTTYFYNFNDKKDETNN